MSENKENSLKRSNPQRKSVLSSKQFVTNAQPKDSFEVSNEFAGYIECVHKLQEDIANLKNEKNELVEICNADINKIKVAYGNEIESLRKALDDSTKEKCSIQYHNDRILEENNNIKIKYAKKIDIVNELQKRLEEAESTVFKNRRNAEHFETISQENEELLRHNSLINEQLKNEISKRTEAESRALTLCDEIEFIKKVNLNNSVINFDSSSLTSNKDNKTEAYYSKLLDEEVSLIREELTSEFNDYKIKLKESSDLKIFELTAGNNKLNEKCNKIYNEKKALLTANDSLEREIAEIKSRLTALTAREAKHQEMISTLNSENENYTREIMEENASLRQNVEEMSQEIAELVNEKIANEKDKYMFRAMLKGEQSRFNLSDVTSPKRKISDSEECSHDVTAWSKDDIKLYCDESYDGSYFELKNDNNDKNVNLNEWKVEIQTASGQEMLYTFPPRVLEANRTLRVWTAGSLVTEDDDNIVMDTALPAVALPMSWRLISDVDEPEATFEVRPVAPKRKILKVARKAEVAAQEKCLLM